jgi:hypothetical protein
VEPLVLHNLIIVHPVFRLLIINKNCQLCLFIVFVAMAFSVVRFIGNSGT